jgi:hypothetical protein
MLRKLTAWFNLERAPATAFAAALGMLCLLGLQVRLSGAVRSGATSARDHDLDELPQWMQRADRNAREVRQCAATLVAMTDKRSHAAMVEVEATDQCPGPPTFHCGLGPDTCGAGRVNSPAYDMAREFSGLKLQMVVLNQVPTALINGRIVQPGTQLQHLTVAEIQSDRVVLSWQESKFELRVSGPRGAP